MESVFKDELLTHLLKGTSTNVGEDFFRSLVKHLCLAIQVKGAWIADFDEEQRMLRSRAFWSGDHYVDHYDYAIEGTPCELVYKNKDFFHVPERVIEIFPNDPDLPPLDAVSYMGVPLFAADGHKVVGHLAVLHDQPLELNRELLDVFSIFADRASAELRRLKQEQITREHREQLNKLMESAMDSIITMDDHFHVVELNPSAKRLLMFDNYKGIDFTQWIHPDHRDKFARLSDTLKTLPEGSQHSWVPKGIILRNAERQLIQAEASLCCYSIDKKIYHSLIIRDINDKLEAEEKISKLTSETHYLKQLIAEDRHNLEIIGQSEAILNVLQQVKQVAPVDTTVLIFGETGTGKELFAQAIHQQSRRMAGEFIKVNCAAIPASLMESEFFGHEKGAFTGATSKREGRFALADNGTIFLDEIGELSLDLQAKLLRVLQEGEFEPVGSSKTKKVNVRVIAATNRDLLAMIKEAKFREDLFYRLCVFPIHLPALRERGDDCILIANSFLMRFAQKFGKKVAPLSPTEEQIVRSYSWPGNIRELQNIIERSVILAHDHTQIRIRIDGFTPTYKEARVQESDRILTIGELEQIEKDNLRKALDACRWKVSGKGGASELLGIKPTTLSSRIKALGLRKITESHYDIS